MTLTGSVPAPRVINCARHIVTNYYIGPAKSQKTLEIWAYTDRMSYAPGDTVVLHVSTTADHFDVEIGRDGAKYQAMKTWSNLKGKRHTTPQNCSEIGCGWPPTLEFTIPAQWRSGGYLLTLRGRRGDKTVEEHHLIIVRGGYDQAPMLLLCATGTWIAYNCWGGSNAYDGISGPDHNAFSPRLSTQRPWSRGFCKLPPGAPRVLPATTPEAGTIARYPHMEWAYAHGYSKKYASAGWASYERHFAAWADTEGYSYDVATLHDLDHSASLLEGYKCVVIVGHDEYWSRKMRLAVDNWVHAGGNLARFAGNFLWQTRIEDQGKTQVCFKHTAAENDPVANTTDQHLLTAAWEDARVDWPGAETVGVNAAGGVYAGVGGCAARGSGGFPIYRPDHWAFQNTHLSYGDILGSDSRIFGYEVDGLDHEIRNGLPYSTGADGAPDDITILGLGLATNMEMDHGIPEEHRYIDRAELAWLAELRYGEVTTETLDMASRGNGVIVHWPKGRGNVFCAATCEWVAGLFRRDRQVEQVTRNVLDKFCG